MKKISQSFRITLQLKISQNKIMNSKASSNFRNKRDTVIETLLIASSSGILACIVKIVKLTAW
jgi:hypothetical protein